MKILSEDFSVKWINIDLLVQQHGQMTGCHIWANPIKSTLDLEIVLQAFFYKNQQKKVYYKEKNEQNITLYFYVTNLPFPKY